MNSPEKSRLRLSHSHSHPNLLHLEVRTPKRTTSSTHMMSPLEVDLGFSFASNGNSTSNNNNNNNNSSSSHASNVSNAKHPRLTSSVSAHSILLLNLVPELLTSSLIDNLAVVTPARPPLSSSGNSHSRYHQRGSSLTFLTPLHSATSSAASITNSISTATTTTPSSRSARRLRNKHLRQQSGGINPFYNPPSFVSPTSSHFHDDETLPFKLSLDRPNPASNDTLVDFYKTMPDPPSFHSSLDFLDNLSMDTVGNNNNNSNNSNNNKEHDNENESGNHSKHASDNENMHDSRSRSDDNENENPNETIKDNFLSHSEHELDSIVNGDNMDSDNFSTTNSMNSQLLFNSDSFSSDIFLQAADLTLKMVSQSKPMEYPQMDSSTINPHLINIPGTSSLTASSTSSSLADHINNSHSNNGNPGMFVNHLQQPNRITRSEGSNNLAGYVDTNASSNASSADSKQLSFVNGSNNDTYFDTLAHPPPPLVHSRSQPQSLLLGSFGGFPTMSSQNDRSGLSMHQYQHQHGQMPTSVSAHLLSSAHSLQPLDPNQPHHHHHHQIPNSMSAPTDIHNLNGYIPTNMISLPEGIDHSKLVIKKSKRGRKSLTDLSDEKKLKKNHECPLCGSRFQRPEHVKRHMRSHSSEKPFHCDQPNCGKRFNRSDNLKAHLRKIHKLTI